MIISAVVNPNNEASANGFKEEKDKNEGLEMPVG